MARVDSGFEACLPQVATGLGRLLSAEEHGEALGIAEWFQVWTISLNEFKGGGERLDQRAGYAGVWHLQVQLSQDRTPVAVARVLVQLAEAAPAGEATVSPRAIYFSPFAGEMRQAIRKADERFGDPAWLARILEIPEVPLNLLWLSRGFVNRFLVPAEGQLVAGRELADEYSEADLRTFLADVVPIVGIAKD
jgi:hypothetical protein